MKKPNLFHVFFLFSSIIFSQANAHAEHFVYEVHCEPTEISDITRVIQGNIWLALRADKTVQKSNISVRIRQLPPVKSWVTEAELLKGTGYSFNTEDLSLSIGGEVVGHSCYGDANLLFDIEVIRKDGSVQRNVVTVPVRVPGAYATSGKYIEP